MAIQRSQEMLSGNKEKQSEKYDFQRGSTSIDAPVD
jgi:hypothetical protein